MIYLDSSVVLSQLFAEDRTPPAAMAQEPMISSRLLEYEIWNRINAKGLTHTRANAVQTALDRIVLIELVPSTLVRALKPFPVALRTLDGLHLATIEYLRARGDDIELASYDRRLLAGARALGIAIYPL